MFYYLGYNNTQKHFNHSLAEDLVRIKFFHLYDESKRKKEREMYQCHRQHIVNNPKKFSLLRVIMNIAEFIIYTCYGGTSDLSSPQTTIKTGYTLRLHLICEKVYLLYMHPRILVLLLRFYARFHTL